ncbi:GNAT family N-acetyltransferase [Paracoccus sediminicola]|uniref:GNAT family N-acetyltransferase n=1 Tax=Paracoccus sediminicola TaxID=3017783 RepID=UPI0022F04E32|nr:GNAT family N-acetyltransferase [Paracoccus sediminicola]WBU57744.1 GNAT family N-acetyltransferase [Paracoccus sediminicola]
MASIPPIRCAPNSCAIAGADPLRGEVTGAALPEFRSERLWLRPRTLRDYDACLAMDRDPEVTRHIPGPWADPELHVAFLRTRITSDYGPGLGYWSVFARSAPDRFLGWVLLIPEDAKGPDIEIGWRFIRAAWGRGYAREAARLVLDHGLGDLALPRIVAGIAAANHASIRVAEKIGMRPLAPRNAVAATAATTAATPRSGASMRKQRVSLRPDIAAGPRAAADPDLSRLGQSGAALHSSVIRFVATAR